MRSSGRAMLRLCCVLAVMAVVAVACRQDRAPTQAVTVITTKSNICIIGCCPGDPFNPLCDPASLHLSSDHGSPISVNVGDTVVFRASTQGGVISFAVTGYSFVPLPITMARRIRGSGGGSLSTQAARAGVVSPSTVTQGRSAPRLSMQILPGVTSCRTSTDSVCFDVFTTSGYEIVAASVNGVSLRDSILVTVAVPAGLALTCSNPAGQSHAGADTLVRAQTVSCKALVTPAGATGALVITDWTFASSDGSFALSRRAVELPFSLDSTVWSGTMVTSGTVTVPGTVGGVADTASSVITVTPRDWSADTVAYQIIRVPTPDVDPPVTVHDLGKNFQGAFTILEPFQSITVGPNTGLAYFTALPYKLTFEVSYNTNAMRVGSAFYGMQPFVNTVFHGVPYCGRFHVTADTVGVKAHEGFRATDINSHTDSFKAAFLRYVRIPSERLVGPAQRLTPDSLRRVAYDTARARSAFVTDTASNPYRSNCSFNFDPNLRIP